MNPWTAAWAGLGVAAAVLEVLAIRSKRRRATLSSNVAWAVKRPVVEYAAIVAWIAFCSWFALHIRSVVP